MATFDNECITTNDKRGQGVRMSKRIYEEIKSFILNQLELQEPMHAGDLIVRCHEHFFPRLKEQTGWLVFKVKEDLEFRGVIVHNNPTTRRQKATISRPRARTTQRRGRTAY